MTKAPGEPQLWNRLDIHDRKQFEIKLEYQPSEADLKTKYRVDMFMFLPASLNIDAETYPRDSFYADIHNYVRLKTPVMGLEDLLRADHSPLVKLERKLECGQVLPESDLVYQAKLLSCIFRSALRRMAERVLEHASQLSQSPAKAEPSRLERDLNEDAFRANKILARYRAWNKRIISAFSLEENSRASIRLVDEYLSLSAEQFCRRALADMNALPKTGLYLEMRKGLMTEVLRQEEYRKSRQLKSVVSPLGDNEEYIRRNGFLKKFCMSILFLSARRQNRNKGWEEMLFAVAAGVAMAFATLVAVWAARFPQVSLNFFLIIVVGYMMKDRIKEGLRGSFSSYASRHLFDRSTHILDPVTRSRVGVCQEKVDYAPPAIPEEISRMRRMDDFMTVSQGEHSETILRYQKRIVIDRSLLPKMMDGISGVTDIIRVNIDRLLRDMDDPEYAIEYVDLEDLTVGKARGVKSYQVDVAFRFTVDEGEQKRVSFQLFRLILDRNGLKRMTRCQSKEHAPTLA